MKISELKRVVKENRYVMIESDLVIFIYGYSHGGTEEFKTEIRINKIKTKDIDIKTGIYCEVEEFNVIKAAVEFAETPPEDREEEKKFYLKHRWMRNINGFSRALKIDIEDGTADVGIMCPSLGYKNQFTKKEIEEIKEKFNTDLADFKEVEVGE